jgi:uncharacterized membrane protein
MDDPVVQQLRQAVTAHGDGLLQNPTQLEQLLASSAASFPGKVKALLILLDKKAVAFLTNWSKDARPNKGSYEQLRQQIAGKFEQAKLLNAAAAGWALDAWATALGVRPESGSPAAPVAAPKAATGLSLVDAEPAAPPPRAPLAAAAAAATTSQVKPATAATNPYAPPAAPVSDPAQEADEAAFIPGGRGVPAGQGWNWIAEGWGLFKGAPVIWIVNVVLFMVIVLAIQLVPVAGGIAGMLLAPVMGAGLMLGARAVHQGEGLEVGHLFAGFRERTGPLVVVGVIYLIATVVIVLAMVMLMGVSFLGLMTGTGSPGAFGAGVLLGVLVALALSIPLMMAYWFAPALVVLNGFGAVDAMKTSFSACLKNILPFLVYGLVGLVLAIIASIPLALGWFVLGPVFVASIYASYRDVFYED